MPELPEVEVVRRGLSDHVVGRTIAKVEVLHPRAVRRHLPGPADFEARLAGRTVTSARRRGKYLWWELGDGEAVLAHLGMSGQLLVRDAGYADEIHLRIRIAFTDDGPELRFVDQRTFGGLSLAELVDAPVGLVPEPIAHIARDPLEPGFDLPSVVAALRRKRTELKRALLDQSLVSGVGNIYADEALWRAKLHWARATEKLSRAAAVAVLTAATEVMTEALAVGGTSFDALYVNVNGQSGYFSRSLAVYGQDGEPCPRCGTPVVREHFMNRSSYYCPLCQRKPRKRLM
ncbi:MAG TPA: bifunctional DNA-formamidopyrimidine glycosylase/DNA-(apurinic or apyrimidinic site) lyase [Pseudonocardiaceae bacterium]|nr:bifunctional DNA-formamidopyrimidine glycosylase/DNA-(apurinic or apyrimidinic site) lyase [Pseudonocardiaceae bacterium]